MPTTPAKPFSIPPGVDPARWRKHWSNCRRAEVLTGIVPVAAEGWEAVAVRLMDMIERKNESEA